MYLTSDLIDYNSSNNLAKVVRADNIKFTLSVHYNSIPFSDYIGVDPNIVNITDEDTLQTFLYNNLARLGLYINSVKNNYGTIKITCTNGQELTIS